VYGSFPIGSLTVVADTALNRHRDEILRIIAAHGGRDVRVFGSRARGDAGKQSDIDILLNLEPGRSLLDLVAIKQDLTDLLGLDVDVVTERSLSPYMRDEILTSAESL
jgi:hypothetical protein